MRINIKVTRMKTLIYRLEAGDIVSARALSRVLTQDQLEDLEKAWVEERACRKVKKPLAIKKYEAMVKNAILLYGRADKMYSLKSPVYKIKSMSQKAEYAFTNAFLFLEEAIEIDPDVQLWIDRELKDASFDPIGIPRVIGSSSPECLVKEKVPYPRFTKRELKIQALEKAILALEPKRSDTEEKTVIFAYPPRRALNFEGFVY